MASVMKRCRVCGKEYEACHTLKHTDGAFRWQEVACSPQCGSVYLAKIRKARLTNQENNIELENTESAEIFDEADADIENVNAELDEYFDETENAEI